LHGGGHWRRGRASRAVRWINLGAGDGEKKGKGKLELENLQKSPILSYVSSFNRFSVPRRPDNGPDIKNHVKPAKNANQRTLQRILVKSVVFCNFVE
jgi:hypothetical protein